MKRLVILAALLAPTTALAADVSGAWKVASSVGATPITVNCNLVQTGTVISGDCTPATGNAGPTSFTGTVDGTHAKWGYDVTFNGKPGHVGFEADLKPDGSMAGALELNGKPSPFTATKQPARP